jgi:hypothetical protein
VWKGGRGKEEEEKKRKSGALLCTGISRRVGSLLVCVSGVVRVRVESECIKTGEERREREGKRD